MRQRKHSLTIICNDTARPGFGIGKLIDAGLVKRVVTSHIGTNPRTQDLMLSGTLEVELVPQGTLAERIRAGGFGLGGVLTPTGVGTLVAEGKQALDVDGRTFIVEVALRPTSRPLVRSVQATTATSNTRSRRETLTR